MASFTTRVELHNATFQDYAALHSHMAKHGFTNIIQSDDGKVYELPPAEYNLIANCSRADVLEKARTAAQKTMKSFAVVVTESAARTWCGLKEAQPARA